MYVSLVGLELIKRHEGYRDARYLDAAGVPTIGYGHAIQPGEVFPDALSHPEALQLLQRDVDRFSDGVARLLTRPVTQPQFDAMVSLAFNIGLQAFRSSTLLRRFNDGDLAGAAEQFPRWRYAKGRELPGLVRRRADERALFLSAVPAPEAA
jgi:lysozyme